MDCIRCSAKTCRTAESCGAEKFSKADLLEVYADEENQKILQAAASLVDHGRAGTLSRIQEIIEFIKTMRYGKVGLAYCYGMENDARKIKEQFKEQGIKLASVSCTVGGITQDEINSNCSIHKVTCNPVGQASQLNSENVEFVIMMGICLGHDILLQRNLKADSTTLVVKDRVFNHNPLLGLKE